MRVLKLYFRNAASGAEGIIPATYVEELEDPADYQDVPDNDSFTSDSGKNERTDAVSEKSVNDNSGVIQTEKPESEPANGYIGL